MDPIETFHIVRSMPMNNKLSSDVNKRSNVFVLLKSIGSTGDHVFFKSSLS